MIRNREKKTIHISLSSKCRKLPMHIVIPDQHQKLAPQVSVSQLLENQALPAETQNRRLKITY